MSKEIQVNRIVSILWKKHTAYRGKARRMAEDLFEAGFGDEERFEIRSEPDPIYTGGVKFKDEIRAKQYGGK